MKIIPIIFLSIILTACGTLKNPEPAIEIAKTVQIAPEALLPCSLLQEDIVLTTFDGVLVAYSDLATKYADCAGKQNNSVKLLKEFGNIK